MVLLHRDNNTRSAAVRPLPLHRPSYPAITRPATRSLKASASSSNNNPNEGGSGDNDDYDDYDC